MNNDFGLKVEFCFRFRDGRSSDAIVLHAVTNAMRFALR